MTIVCWKHSCGWVSNREIRSIQCFAEYHWLQSPRTQRRHELTLSAQSLNSSNTWWRKADQTICCWHSSGSWPGPSAPWSSCPPACLPGPASWVSDSCWSDDSCRSSLAAAWHNGSCDAWLWNYWTQLRDMWDRFVWGTSTGHHHNVGKLNIKIFHG